MAIDFYFELMKLLEIPIFDSRYEPWIYLTIYRKLKPNSNLFDPLTLTGQLYPIISLFNHDCDPNACYTDDTSKLIQRGEFSFSSFSSVSSTQIEAARNVQKGEQVFINYTLGHDFSVLSVVGNTVKSSGSTKKTQQLLETTYGFRCKCRMCDPSSN